MRLASLAGGLLAVLGGIACAAEGDDLVVTGDGVNVRARPQSGAPILLQVHRPELAVEVARDGDWVRVRLPERNTAGWIHGSLLAAADGGPPAGAEGAAAPPAAAEPPGPATSGAAAGAAPAAIRPAPTASGTAPPTAAGPAQTEAEAAANRGADAATSEPAPPDDPQVAALEPPAADPLARFRASVDSLNRGALAAAGVDLFADVRLAGQDVAQVIAAEAWTMVPEAGRQSYLNVLHDRWLAIVGSPRASVQVVDQTGRVLSERAGP